MLCLQFALHLGVLVSACRLAAPYTSSTSALAALLDNAAEAVSSLVSGASTAAAPDNSGSLGNGTDSTAEFVDVLFDGKFVPNVINTSIYLVSSVMTLSTFLANYIGRPFMQPLRSNTPLFRAICGGLLALFVLAAEIFPDVNAWMELHPLPDENYRFNLTFLMSFDVAASYVYAQLVRYVIISTVLSCACAFMCVYLFS